MLEPWTSTKALSSGGGYLRHVLLVLPDHSLEGLESVHGPQFMGPAGMEVYMPITPSLGGQDFSQFLWRIVLDSLLSVDGSQIVLLREETMRDIFSHAAEFTHPCI